MIELLFLAQNFQCGLNAPLAEFKVVVIQNEEGKVKEHTLEVGERLVFPKDELQSMHVLPLKNANCVRVHDSIEVTVDTLPNVAGLFNQPSIQQYKSKLKDSESIYLFEFGAYRGPAADYQDVVLKVDWDYEENINANYAD